MKLQQTQCMISKGKSTFYNVKGNNACISTELANLIHDKVEKNQVLRIDAIEKEEKQIELDEDKEKTPMRHC